MSNAKRVLKQAQDLARSVTTWADLSNALFDPVNGLVSQAYPTRAEREAFMKTEEYQKIRKLLRDAIDEFGLIEGAAPETAAKSGRFVVRLPRSLHAALEREADREGVSLNQLVVAKLAAQLSSLV